MVEHVLRVPREDSTAADDVVLVNVRPPVKHGGEMVIEGTEGETPYVGKFTSAALASARASNSPLPASLWTAALTHLLQRGPAPSLPTPASALSLTASLDPSKSLTLHIRQTVSSGISQRLGELKLSAAPDYEIDTLAWTATAIKWGETVVEERNDTVTKARECETRIKSLVKQLEELVAAKREGEDQMLVAFADVLNAKKRKVRELQRMLEELRVKSTPGDEISETNDHGAKPSGRKRTPGSSRKGKRKAKEEPEEAELNMAIDRSEEHAEDSEASSNFERLRSPAAEREDESTEQESGDEADVPSPPSAQRRLGTLGAKKAIAREGEPGEDGKMVDGGRAGLESKKPVEPPPQRELPFTRQREAAQKRDEGDETSDDEL